jgi:hypothetical protein
MYGTPPPPPKSRPTALIVLGIVLLVVVVLGGGITTVVLVGRHSSTPNAQAAGTPAPGATASQQAKVTLSAPDRIGNLRKKADQSRADSMRTMMSTAGLEQPFAVVYENPAAPGHDTIVWGGTGGAFAMGTPKQQLDAFFAAAGGSLGNGVTVGTATAVDPGSVGGQARCAKINGLGVKLAMCAWTGSSAVLGFLCFGVAPDQAGGQVKQVLPAVVKS